jgi:hypothetical protein
LRVGAGLQYSISLIGGTNLFHLGNGGFDARSDIGNPYDLNAEWRGIPLYFQALPGVGGSKDE